MTEPNPGRPVPVPPRPGPQPDATRAAGSEVQDEQRFAGLEERPVAEHVAVFEAEHDRLQRELGTIDQL